MVARFARGPEDDRRPGPAARRPAGAGGDDDTDRPGPAGGGGQVVRRPSVPVAVGFRVYAANFDADDGGVPDLVDGFVGNLAAGKGVAGPDTAARAQLLARRVAADPAAYGCEGYAAVLVNDPAGRTHLIHPVRRPA